jgi:hypothetical protein
VANEAKHLRAWDYLRALLISLVLFSQCVSATPARPFDEQNLARREGERFVTTVQSALAWLGQHPERAAIKAWLIDRSRVLVDARNATLRPLESVSDLASIRQQWGLFMVSQLIAFRIQVDVRKTDGPWQLIFRKNAEDKLGLAPWLSYRRLRGIYNPRVTQGPHAQYAGFVTWLGRTVLAEHPEYGALRVRMERLALATREHPNQSLGFEDEQIYEREPPP